MTVPNETLNDFIKGDGYGVAPSAVVEMARELLALRKAFSEPAAWVPMSQLSLLWKKKGVVVEAELSAIQRFDEVPLYCKPTLPE